ncbi:molybdenum cofactor guanylyltransferase [Nocardioides agariphilus]|uniref:molybdenum cofactor guanylyltransferase n=1 Tax=Nocardioides agariphilus TaxID=433664 RepID=UPI003520566D
MVFDAVVLAGGRATRLGGADKAAVEVNGTTLLERTLAAVRAAHRVVVVGDEHPTSRPVLWTREHPPYGGPVAATYAGLEALRRGSPVRLTGQKAEMTRQPHGSTPLVVLAVDMPGVGEGTVRRLVAGMQGHDGAVLVDGGRRHLAFAVEAEALARVRPAEVAGAAMRGLWASLDLADVPARDDEAYDVDEWSDLEPS